MSETTVQNGPGKLSLVASVLALVGLADALYLTVQHYQNAMVPCSLSNGCEFVLNSPWSEIGGYPLSLFGALGYFTAFCFAILAFYGNRVTWKLLGLQTIFMAGFSLWLIYLQGFVIQYWCQYCLLSAATSISLFLIALVSRFWRS